MRKIKLKHPKCDISKIQTQINAVPSTAWFAVRALEGFSKAADIIKPDRIGCADKFSQIEKTDHDVTCWRCDGDIFHPCNDGWCMPYQPKIKFNDHWENRGKHNTTKVLCAACEALSNARYHPNFLLSAVYTKNKAYQLTLDVDLIGFLVSPPPPPFTFCIAEKKSQHMAWLCHYTVDSDVLMMHRGRNKYLVSRSKALRIAEMYIEILEQTNKIKISQNKDVLATPLATNRILIAKKEASEDNMQISPNIINTIRIYKKDDEVLIKAKKGVQRLIDELESLPYTFGTWFIATMYIKLMLHPEEIHTMDKWQKIKPIN